VLTSLSLPGCWGLPKRSQSRWARPPCQAPVLKPRISVLTPACSKALVNTSTSMATDSMCCFIEPEQSIRKASTQSD
jgi:hypothetical protein